MVRPPQGVTKRCRLSWLTNSALVNEPKMRGEGGGESRDLSHAMSKAINLWVTQFNVWKIWTMDRTSAQPQVSCAVSLWNSSLWPTERRSGQQRGGQRGGRGGRNSRGGNNGRWGRWERPCPCPMSQSMIVKVDKYMWNCLNGSKKVIRSLVEKVKFSHLPIYNFLFLYNNFLKIYPPT